MAELHLRSEQSVNQLSFQISWSPVSLWLLRRTCDKHGTLGTVEKERFPNFLKKTIRRLRHGAYVTPHDKNPLGNSDNYGQIIIFQWVNQLFLGPFSIAMLVYQRVRCPWLLAMQTCMVWLIFYHIFCWADLFMSVNYSHHARITMHNIRSMHHHFTTWKMAQHCPQLHFA